ncbi:hypothetical protein JCM3765_001511 [Sporobolomyces pararoseus]
MGYSPTSVAVPLLYTASSTVLSLAWKVVSTSTSAVVSTSTSSLRVRTSKSLDESNNLPVRYESRQQQKQRVPSQMELRLSTSCQSCGERVSLEVPKWISDSVDIAQNHSSGGCCEGSNCQRTAGRDSSTAGEIRKLVVEGTVGIAQAVKASPILPILLAAVKAFVAFAIYLDARFLLRQQAASAATEVATGLVEIEKELGLMRNVGEGLSIGWEALVKSIIALARTDSPPTSQAPQPDFPRPSNKVYPYTRLDTFDQSSMYRDEPVSPTYSSSSHRYLSTDMDTSGAPTLTPPSPTGGSTLHLSAPHYIPPLRRTPLSSPILRTNYLSAQSSGTSTPSSQYFHEARLAPQDPSYHPTSYSHEYSDTSFELDSNPVNHRRSRSGPDTSSSTSSERDGVPGSSWPTRTMLGWADRLLTRADSLQHLR